MDEGCLYKEKNEEKVQLFKIKRGLHKLYNLKLCNIRTITHNSSVVNSGLKQGLIKEPCLTPNWVTGFSDAEGCFSVIISKVSALRWRIIVSF